METIVILLLFVGAMTYLGNRLRLEFSPKNKGCNKDCGCE
jgi:hypothetical protein